jgi:hypothetical protein
MEEGNIYWDKGMAKHENFKCGIGKKNISASLAPNVFSYP